jgi:nicotinamidase/pyrazinamidase
MSALFIDVDTQLDFLYPAGALYVPGAEKIVPSLAHLNRYAARHGIPVLSTVDAHTEDDPEFQTWPKHCVAGALGQQKPAVTLRSKRVVVPNREGAVELEGAEQIILEKQTTDAFRTVTIAGVLAALNSDRFVVYGVVTEICVLHAVRGLLKLGKPVTVIADAIQHLSARGFEDAIAEMKAAGVSISGTLCEAPESAA